MTLGALIEKTLVDGLPNRMAGPIAKLIDVAPDTPIHLLRVAADQTSDQLTHVFRVMVEVVPETKHVKPLGLALDTHQIWPGNDEDYWFRASLDGGIERVAVIRGKRDDQNRVIKGSGATTEPDISSPEIKKRFQHELDFWLKKTYLKNEWRSAGFSGGVLKKTAKPR